MFLYQVQLKQSNMNLTLFMPHLESEEELCSTTVHHCAIKNEPINLDYRPKTDGQAIVFIDFNKTKLFLKPLQCFMSLCFKYDKWGSIHKRKKNVAACHLLTFLLKPLASNEYMINGIPNKNLSEFWYSACLLDIFLIWRLSLLSVS